MRDEETPLEPADCNKTVLVAERSVARFSGAGRTGVVLRFAAFYGPDAMQVQSYISGLHKGWSALPGGPDRYISSISHDREGSFLITRFARKGEMIGNDALPLLGGTGRLLQEFTLKNSL
jgi:hypothetical protein